MKVGLRAGAVPPGADQPMHARTGAVECIRVGMLARGCRATFPHEPASSSSVDVASNTIRASSPGPRTQSASAQGCSGCLLEGLGLRLRGLSLDADKASV